MRRRPWIRIALLTVPTLIVAGAWVYTRFATDGYWVLAHTPGLIMVSGDRLWVEIQTGDPVSKQWPRDEEVLQVIFPTKEISPWERHAFGAVETATAMKPVDGRTGYPVRIYHISLIALLLATSPALLLTARLFWRSRQSERRHAAGLCAACGYDMRATPERCPECGFVPLPVCLERVG